MKKISVLTLVFGMLFSFNALASQFCDGFKQGYISGRNQAKGINFTSITPVCPVQPVRGFGDPKSDYEFGYTIGYRTGMYSR
jgi:hypothetical protein|tara:strand:+ start:311 stop:556 length:246 start_codon:yes stop_codon:yes gene_type:complete